MDHYKAEDAFKRCLRKLTIEDVKAAIRRAEEITDLNKKDGKKRINYKGYAYYQDKPALSMHEAVKKILQECGLLESKKS